MESLSFHPTPHTNIQYNFTLKTRSMKSAKKITSTFLLKSSVYFEYLQNLTKAEIVIRYDEIRVALDQYRQEALDEYSQLERDRHAHFTHNKADGAHPDSIEHWLKEMQEHICVRRTEKQTQELARKILTRSSMPLKTFFKSITSEERMFFFQSLLKTEAKILKHDNQRAMEYFNPNHESLPSNSVHDLNPIGIEDI